MQMQSPNHLDFSPVHLPVTDSTLTSTYPPVSCSSETEGVILQFADGAIQSCNLAAEQIIGFTKEQMRGCRGTDCPWQMVDEKGSTFSNEQYPAQVALQTGQPCLDRVMGIYRPDGTLVWVRIDAYPLFQANEKTPHAVVSTLTKTVELKGQSQSLESHTGQELASLQQEWAAFIDPICAEETQRRYRDFAELLPHFVWMADAQGAIHYWNRRWYEHTGLSEAESMGLAGSKILHPDEVDRVLEQWRRSVTSGEAFESECQVRHWQGHYRWFLCRGVPTRDRQGKIAGWIGTMTDIDDLKRQQEALQQSELFKQRMLESSRDCIKVLDLEGKLLYMNPGGQRLMEIDDFKPFLNLDWPSCWEVADRDGQSWEIWIV